MQDKYQLIKNLETQLEFIDAEMLKNLKRIEHTYQSSDIPLPVRREIENLIDSRKNFADRIQEMRSVLENSWEELEKGAIHMLEELHQSIKNFPDQMN